MKAFEIASRKAFENVQKNAYRGVLMKKLHDYRGKSIFEWKTLKPASVDTSSPFVGKKRLKQD